MKKINLEELKSDIRMDIGLSHTVLLDGENMDAIYELEEFTTVTVRLVGTKDLSDEEIGHIIFTKIPSSLKGTNPDLSMGEMMDDENEDLGFVASMLNLFDYYEYDEDKNEYEEEKILKKKLKTSDLYYVDKIVIDKKYRGYGFGETMILQLPNIIKTIFNEKDAIMTLRAYPIEKKKFSDETINKYQRRLFKFYKKCGWKNVGGNVFLNIA